VSYAIQRDAIIRTRQELIVIGVRDCQNHYTSAIEQVLQYTEEVDNGSFWFKTSVTVSADDAEAPDGTMTADTVTYNATSDQVVNISNDETDVSSKAYTGSIWLRAPNGPETVTIDVRNAANTESGEKQVTVTTTWERFYIHNLFTATPTDAVAFGIIRKAGDDMTDLEVWGVNINRNPSDLDKEIPFPYVKRVNEAVATLAQNVSRCQAADAGDGARCFYSRVTCQDPDNFNAGNTYEDTARGKGIREYRFCRKQGPLPLSGVEARPYLIRSASAAQEIDAERAVTVNERMTFEFEDDGDPGIWNIRQSTEGGLVNTATGVGSFWPRWAAIYPNYMNPECYLIRKVGFVEAGAAESDFQTRGKFLMRNYEYVNRKMKITCADRLKLTRKSIPAKIDDSNTLTAAITAGATSFVVRDASEFSSVSDDSSYTVVLQNEHHRHRHQHRYPHRPAWPVGDDGGGS
jgi:hypothetical protein